MTKDPPITGVELSRTPADRERSRSWLSRPISHPLEALLTRTVSLEIAGYAALVAVAFTLRIWDLGARAMHHDESLHATYAWYLFKGQGYQYNPLMHGPLQFYAIAFFYLLFGDSETTARLFAVLCGTGIVLLPYYLRHSMGRFGAFIGAVALTISPAFLYYSRFARDDIYLDFFTLLMVVGIWRYVRLRKRSSLILVATAAALAMASMEAAYIVFFIFFAFFVLVIAVEKLDNKRESGLISKAVSSISIDSWVTGAAIFIITTVLLFSTFLSDPSGILDLHHGLLSPNRQDILGGLTYWISQHGVARGGQPWFYYLLLFPLYEQFALIFGTAGIIWAMVLKDLFTTFLAFWFVMALALFSWAGEKMPWLFLHPLLPGLLLAASFTGHLLKKLDRPGRAVLTVGLVLLLLAEIHSAQALAFSNAANPTEMLIYVQTSNDVPMVAQDVIRLTNRMPTSETHPLIQVDNADLQGWPFEWYFRNLPSADVAYTNNFSNPSAPILIMLQPEHDEYNADLTSHYIVGTYRWNWWFPEDYKGLTFDNGMCGTAVHEVACPSGQAGTVFLKTGTPCAAGATAAGVNCSLIQTPAAINIFSAATDASTWQHLWNWYFFRTPFGARGDRPLYLYVRKNLVPGFHQRSSSGQTSGNYTPLPAAQVGALGSTGAPSGRLTGPRGITVANNGRIYVADSGSHRVSIFTSHGRFLKSFGGAGTGTGLFNINDSPMDVAVGRDDDVFVADWWNHRIEEFTSGGTFIRAWGRYGSQGHYDFYGPRSLSIGSNGDLYVADTGNRRIEVFSQRGKFLFSFGAAGSLPGQFEEPSSVVTAPRGDVYVADMWNSRIQRFNATGHFLGSWGVPSWQPNTYQEPYLAVTSTGDILATDPSLRRVLEFSPTGHKVGEFSVPNFQQPIGIAVGPGGRIYVSDATANHVDILQLPAAKHSWSKGSTTDLALRS